MRGLIRASGNYDELAVKTAGGTIAANDPVSPKTDGQFEVTAVGAPIWGIAMEAAVSGELFYVMRPIKGVTKFWMESDQVGDTLASDLESAKFDIVGATGNVRVDVSTAAQVGDGTDSGQVALAEYTTLVDSVDSKIGVFTIEELY